MFEMRFSESYGAPPELLEQFMVQARLDDQQDECMLLLVRSRQSGRMSCVKCQCPADADPKPAGAEALSNEAQILKGLNHRHICAIDPGQEPTQLPFLKFAYWGQRLLNEADWASWPGTDRVRAIIQLVDAVSYLQALDQPVSHGAFALNRLWYAPATHWVQLSGFERARIGAEADDLKKDRQAVVDLAAAMMPEQAGEQDWHTSMDAWVAEGNAVVDEFKLALQRHMFAVVTADL